MRLSGETPSAEEGERARPGEPARLRGRGAAEPRRAPEDPQAARPAGGVDALEERPLERVGRARARCVLGLGHRCMDTRPGEERNDERQQDDPPRHHLSPGARRAKNLAPRGRATGAGRLRDQALSPPEVDDEDRHVAPAEDARRVLDMHHPDADLPPVRALELAAMMIAREPGGERLGGGRRAL